MLRKEAMSFAISTYKPIRHILFGPDEYIKFNGKELVDEEGIILPYNEFWNIRCGGIWDDGWSEYKK